MQKDLRAIFNANFTEEIYQAYMQKVDGLHPGALEFRNAETPIFIPKDFTKKMLDACDDILDVITAPNFKSITERSIPQDLRVPGYEGDHPECLVFDFGICENKDGDIEPQLIEMQGFPTLFAFQAFHSKLTAAYAEVPANYSAYLGGFDEDKYVQLLKDIVLDGEKPAHVILLEIYPDQQKTRIDFYCTEKLLGIKTVCLTKLIAENDNLFYMNDGVKTQVHRIYNRIIFDDLQHQARLENHVDLSKPYNVKWVPHPHWFYRISKFTLPFIDNPYVPETFFLNEVTMPLNLADYVLKPLFSFAGMGVVIDLEQEDLDKITDPENWILQRKVQYAAIIQTPDEPAKAEIRLFYFWEKDAARPVAVHNLSRLSKGKMIGTRYNKDKTWVGGTVAFFEKY